MGDFDQVLLAVMNSKFSDTLYISLGAIGTLLFLFAKDYRASKYIKKGYFWYLFKADRKKTDDVVIVVVGMIAAELVTGALTGLAPEQLLMAGSAIGTATKMKTGG